MRFQEIGTRDELASFIKIPKNQLTYVLYVNRTSQYYKTFELPKKSGGVRIINSPTGLLKTIQTNLSNALYEAVNSPKREKYKYSHAFERKKSIITNAKIHRNKRYVLNIDLEDFFNSFHFGRVRGFFHKNNQFKLPLDVATIIAQLTTYEGALPQGAPTSPIITNLICEILDFRISKLAKKYRVDYTRYADDLTFSTNDKHFVNLQDEFYNELSSLLERSGFKINISKRRLQYKDTKQMVTGLVVNKKINVEREYYKTTRAMANQFYKFNFFEIDGELATINQLEGRFTFINQLSWYNNKLEGKAVKPTRLSSKEKQYQRFLFYKYFYVNEKPVLVTEGKTDVTYLKAALKNLYKDYPELIAKNEDGTFKFKVEFLNRTKRLSHLMGIYKDGASPLKNIYNMFTGKNSYPNHLDYFKNISYFKQPLQPIILILDNELHTKDKPLKDFVQTVKDITTEKKEIIERESKVKILENLFLVTVPLTSGKRECDIEDLFEQKVLETTVDGKGFKKDGDFDISNFYGKEIFAKKVIQPNFREIDFKNFKPMLNNIVDVIQTYNQNTNISESEKKLVEV